mmetsp:Transcript_7785/g.19317  ORF Transcript_7785/g.19317 Transcript_7785/m.19317 type:complete len:104 (+) Transcript_7785:280-591(+)
MTATARHVSSTRRATAIIMASSSPPALTSAVEAYALFLLAKGPGAPRGRRNFCEEAQLETEDAAVERQQRAERASFAPVENRPTRPDRYIRDADADVVVLNEY